jgi:hypothetical protein
MHKHSAQCYLLLSVRFSSDRVTELLDQAERDGKAEDERATVTFKAGVYEVYRPSFAHFMGTSNYLDDLHPVDCTQCYCRHYRHNGRSNVLQSDPPSTCRCGHLCMRHRFREVRQTLEICKAPETWFTDDMQTFNALLG